MNTMIGLFRNLLIPGFLLLVVSIMTLSNAEEKAVLADKAETASTAQAEAASKTATAAETKTEAKSTDSDSIVTYQASDEYSWVKEALESAITDRGLKISSTLHISDMLERTGKDLGIEKAVYGKAESIEFCSAMMSHRMAEADARNLAICPFTVAVYTKAEAPEQVYVSWRKPVLVGGDAGQKVEDDLYKLLDGIAKEAAGL